MKELLSLGHAAQRYAGEFGVLPDIHLDDFIFRFLLDNPSFSSPELAVHYYFYDGRNSAEKLAALLEHLQLEGGKAQTMLEFASGYGCLTRHLSTVLPTLRSVACDIHAQAVKFIHERLKSEVMLSCADPDEFVDKGQYDVVFARSFFSHMPETTWGRWLNALYRAVNSGGALIFTTQGEHSAKYFGAPDLGTDGFWFVADSEQKDLDVATYGQTIVSEAFVQRETKAMLGRAVDLVRPGYWWEHQDLYVVRKPDAPILIQSERIAG